METTNRKAGETPFGLDQYKDNSARNTAELSKYDCTELITPLRDQTIHCCLWV